MAESKENRKQPKRCRAIALQDTLFGRLPIGVRLFWSIKYAKRESPTFDALSAEFHNALAGKTQGANLACSGANLHTILEHGWPDSRTIQLVFTVRLGTPGRQHDTPA